MLPESQFEIKHGTLIVEKTNKARWFAAGERHNQNVTHSAYQRPIHNVEHPSKFSKLKSKLPK